MLQVFASSASAATMVRSMVHERMSISDPSYDDMDGECDENGFHVTANVMKIDFMNMNILFMLLALRIMFLLAMCHNVSAMRYSRVICLNAFAFVMLFAVAAYIFQAKFQLTRDGCRPEPGLQVLPIGMSVVACFCVQTACTSHATERSQRAMWQERRALTAEVAATDASARLLGEQYESERGRWLAIMHATYSRVVHMSVGGVVLKDLTEGKPTLQKAKQWFPLHVPVGCDLRSFVCCDSGEQGLPRFDAFLADLSERRLRHVPV